MASILVGIAGSLNCVGLRSDIDDFGAEDVYDAQYFGPAVLLGCHLDQGHFPFDSAVITEINDLDDIYKFVKLFGYLLKDIHISMRYDGYARNPLLIGRGSDK